MALISRPLQQEHGATNHHLTAMLQKRLNQFLKIQYFRLAIDQAHHIDAEHRLELGLCVEIIQYDLAEFASTQFNHDARISRRFISQFGDAFDLFLFDQLRDAFNQPGTVQLIRYLCHDDSVFTGLLIRLDLATCSNQDPASSRTVG